MVVLERRLIFRPSRRLRLRLFGSLAMLLSLGKLLRIVLGIVRV